VEISWELQTPELDSRVFRYNSVSTSFLESAACADKAKLEPYLGFLHNMAKGKPSLACDFQELYRYLIGDFVIQYCRKLNRKDFTVKSEDFSKKRKGKREYLNDSQTHDFVTTLNRYFQSKINIPRVRMGEQQEIETLINEEASLFAMFLRNEHQSWNPRIVQIEN